MSQVDGLHSAPRPQGSVRGTKLGPAGSTYVPPRTGARVPEVRVRVSPWVAQRKGREGLDLCRSHSGSSQRGTPRRG